MNSARLQHDHVGAQHAAPQAHTHQRYLPQSVLSFFPLTQTATQHNSPPTTCSPLSNSSHNPNPPNAAGAQTHLHSETGAASTSSTKKISAPPPPAANKHPNTTPSSHSILAYKNQPALALKREHPPEPNSVPSLPSAERCVPPRQTETISHAASVPPQNSASASRLFAESLRRATQIHHASQIAFAIPSSCDRSAH